VADFNQEMIILEQVASVALGVIVALLVVGLPAAYLVKKQVDAQVKKALDQMQGFQDSIHNNDWLIGNKIEEGLEKIRQSFLPPSA